MTTELEPTLTVTDTPDAAASAVINVGLAVYNSEMAGYRDSRHLSVIVSCGQEVVGGLTGRTSLGLFFIDLFFLPAELRGAGLGGRVLAAGEAEARRRGCTAAALYTISFQAPDLYIRHGYEAFGEIPCAPPGTSRIFLKKDLLRPAAAADD
jgi:GNAT superfamily N-acetyltransferase